MWIFYDVTHLLVFLWFLRGMRPHDCLFHDSHPSSPLTVNFCHSLPLPANHTSSYTIPPQTVSPSPPSFGPPFLPSSCSLKYNQSVVHNCRYFGTENTWMMQYKCQLCIHNYKNGARRNIIGNNRWIWCHLASWYSRVEDEPFSPWLISK